MTANVLRAQLLFVYGKVFHETLQAGVQVNFPFSEIIFEAETKFQRVSYVRTEAFGRALFIDDIINSSEADEFVYHEGIVHPAMMRAARRKSALIIGGGEGATLREILKYKSIERAVMVDIDEELVRLCQRHLTDVYGDPWQDPRVQLHFGDGREFVERGEKFDAIIIDLNEPTEDSPARRLYTKEFYELVRAALNPGGVISVQSEWIHMPFHVDLSATMAAVFGGVRTVEVNIPCFMMPTAFNLCSVEAAQLDVTPERIDELIAENDLQLSYYNGEVDRKISIIPPYLQKMKASGGRVFSDAELPDYYE